MGRFDVGISEGVTAAGGTARRIDLRGVVARDELHAIAQARAAWQEQFHESPPSALIEISWRY